MPDEKKPSIAEVVGNIDFSDVFIDNGETVIDLEDETTEETTTNKNETKEEESKEEDTETSETETITEETNDEENTEEESNEKEVQSFISEINTKLGYDVDLENVSDDEDGLLEYIPRVANKIADDKLQELYATVPDVKEYLDFRLAGGKPDQYFNTVHPQTNYNDITEIKADNLALQEGLIRSHLQLQGMDEEDIAETITELKDKELLHSNSLRSLKILQKYQGEEAEILLEQTKIEQETKNKETEKFWTDVKNKIENTQSFDGILISTKDKQGFYEFMSTPQREFNNQTEIDHIINNMTIDEQLALNALIFKTKKQKIPLAKLIAKKASSKGAETLRDKLNKSSVKPLSDENNKKRTTIKSAVDNIDLSALSN